MQGCIGYHNYQYFIQYALWGGVFASIMSVKTYLNTNVIPFNIYDYTFFIAISILQIFAWFVFVMYFTLMAKGLTVIEAADRFNKRHETIQQGVGENGNTGIRLVANKRFKDNLLVTFGTSNLLCCLIPLRRKLPNPFITYNF